MRDSIELKDGWRFHRGDPEGAQQPEYDDSAWESVRVPHDWAIAGPFDPENDVQRLAIHEDKMTSAVAHTGRSGALPVSGPAWYRLELTIPKSATGKRVLVEFDGAMSDSTVFLNRTPVGGWPYGYTSFVLDVTEAVRFGDSNLLAVRLNPPPHASRWYPGAGIYRRVRLTLVEPVHFAPQGVRVVPKILPGSNKAQVVVTAKLSGEETLMRRIQIEGVILDADGCEVADVRSGDVAEASCNVSLDLQSPKRWDLEHPYLYRLRLSLLMEGTAIDTIDVPFGVRSLRFDAAEGFFLNERRVEMRGVCLHHDLGPLGTAVNTRALQRQLEIMQDMGANAIRTTHNPPDPAFLDLCDRMGFLVIVEAFDEWRTAKMPGGYHRLFEEWAEKDLRAMIRRDANHPSVILWSIGNEIPDQRSPDGAAIARRLRDICHDEDPTRLVTAGFNEPDAAIANGLADAVDVIGWNYRTHDYARYHRERPDWIMYGSETASTVSSRGVYLLPAVEVRDARNDKHPILQVSSYDLSALGWGVLPDEEFGAQEEHCFLSGEFVWTGIDYLGEPTPFYSEWPSRSSYFGAVDLCGHPKDRFYLYRSHWRPEVPTLHLLPHWTWPGHEGQNIPVFAYSNFPCVELFLNGKSLGRRIKDPASRLDRYRFRWNDVIYAPGALRAVAYDSEGKAVMDSTVHTAGEPAAIRLDADRTRLTADGEDLAFITARVVDANGHVCPHSSHRLTFHIDGPAEVLAVGNGDPTATESFAKNSYPAFGGVALFVLRTKRDTEGAIVVHCRSTHLLKTHIDLEAYPPA